MKNCYKFLNHHKVKLSMPQLIQKLLIPEKVKIFTYLCYHDKILTQENLTIREVSRDPKFMPTLSGTQRRGSLDDGMCILQKHMECHRTYIVFQSIAKFLQPTVDQRKDKTLVQTKGDHKFCLINNHLLMPLEQWKERVIGIKREEPFD